MKKLALALFALLVVSVVIADPATYQGMDNYATGFNIERQTGVERVTNYDPRVNFARMDSIVYLRPIADGNYYGAGRGGEAPFYSRGSARIMSSSWYGFPRAQAVIQVKDFPVTDKERVQFEVWLVDTQTNYRLSLGSFTTMFGGIGTLDYRIDNYFDAYDLVEITVEPLDDMDEAPGEVIVIGAIPPPTHYSPAPKDSKMLAPTIKVI